MSDRLTTTKHGQGHDFDTLVPGPLSFWQLLETGSEILRLKWNLRIDFGILI